MKNVLLLFVLSLMSVFIFSMQDSLSSEQIIQQCNQDIAHAQAHIRDIDGLLNGLKPVSLDHQRQKEMWAAIALVTNNWNEKKTEFKDLKQKEIASHQAYITYLANARLIFLAEIQKNNQLCTHSNNSFLLSLLNSRNLSAFF